VFDPPRRKRQRKRQRLAGSVINPPDPPDPKTATIPAAGGGSVK